ncbi:hypothetical protein [Azospirillum halopraeferens]|uniref:hypothetical protein n=1 Tax=Azospirillum halopraeferens TaxID=34010 RepID=UPI000425AD98|nr:hypothetical protein [Azospirillum halopraeferens]
MRVTYTYRGSSDAAFEDAMLGVVRSVAPARAAGRREDPQGFTAVTLDVDLNGPSDTILGSLRTHERIIDVAQDGGPPEAAFDELNDPVRS